MNYYIIEPEVVGEIGEKTTYSNYNEIIHKKDRPIISHLHIIFDGWLGDELLEVTPCFMVSERLMNEMISLGFSGCKFESLEMSFSNLFYDLYPNRKVPIFYRLLPQKIISIEDDLNTNSTLEDVMMSRKQYLIVSDRLKTYLFEHHYIENADCTIINLDI